MGKKAKLKKARQQQKTAGNPDKQYDSTQFVKQFKQMGYQLPSKDKFDSKSNRANIAPEIPQDKIEPQL